MSLYGEELAVLDVTRTDAEPHVVNPRLVHELRRILTTHPGRAPFTCGSTGRAAGACC